MVYERCVQPLVGSCLDGYNVTVLAYGQTGSGKSFTMGSEDSLGVLMSAERKGLIPRYSGPSHIRTPWDWDWSICVKCQFHLIHIKSH